MNLFDLYRTFRMAEGDPPAGGAPAPAPEPAPTPAPEPTPPPTPAPEPEPQPASSILTGGQKDAPPPEGNPAPTPEKTPEVADFEGIKAPEGFSADDWDGAALKAIAPTFKELGLSVEQATKITHGYAAMVQARVAEQKQLTDAYVARITSETQAAFTPEQLDDAARCFQKFATPEMMELWNNPLLGNNKAFVGVFVKMAALTKDDSLPGGNPGEPVKKRDADVFFPSMNK